MRSLSPKDFSTYPPQGRNLALSHLPALRQLPVALLPVFLVDLKIYDWKFPVEQQEIVRRIEFAEANPSALADFRGITVSPELLGANQVADPQRYLVEMTAFLWSSLQMDMYRAAADKFVKLLGDVAEPVHLEFPRLVMICIGRDAQRADYPLFHKLRPFGQLRTNVKRKAPQRPFRTPFANGP